MEIILKFVSLSNTEKFASVEDAETFLNQSLYYCDNLQLSSSFDDFNPYNNETDLAEMMDDAQTFGNGVIHVAPMYE